MRVLLSHFDKLSNDVKVLMREIQSPFYEVRIDSLSFMHLILTSAQDTDSDWLENDRNIWDLNSEQIKLIYVLLCESKELWSLLWQLCLTEKHPDCLSENLKVLTQFTSHLESGIIQDQPQSIPEVRYRYYYVYCDFGTRFFFYINVNGCIKCECLFFRLSNFFSTCGIMPGKY